MLLGYQNKDVLLLQRQGKAAAPAVKALGRVEAAVQTGVTYHHYLELVADAKAAVNEALLAMPEETPLKKHLAGAMEAYEDGATVWHKKLQFPGIGLREEFGDGPLIKRHELPLEANRQTGVQEVDCDLALQVIWARAATHLAFAKVGAAWGRE
jgi:hypothetical protein